MAGTHRAKGSIREALDSGEMKGGRPMIKTIQMEAARSAPPSSETADGLGSRGCVLVVDDEQPIRRAVARQIRKLGYRALEAGTARQALEVIEADSVDIVMTDLAMPDVDGLDLLESLKTRKTEIPVLFTTGLPSVETAARAMELGAFRYLVKPVTPEAMRGAIDAAMQQSARARAAAHDENRELEARFQRALATLYLHFQPIVGVDSRAAYGFEALMRSGESTLPHPGAVLEAAEKLGALHVLGRRIRRLTAAAIETASAEPRFFVNVHAADLSDPDLFDPEAPLSKFAHRIVLEITERASLESVGDVTVRLAALRALGYRVALDDLGAGYAGLSYFALVSPDIIKIDMSLVRGIDTDPVRQRVVLAMVALATALGMEVVAEGIETREEREMVIALGCHYLQGYALGRPGAPFPAVSWP